MHSIIRNIYLAGLLTMPCSLVAAPAMVTAMKSTAQTYTFFFANEQQLISKSINPVTFKQSVADQLPVGVKPCWTSVDGNATDIRCGDLATGQMQLGFNEIFSYTGETLLPKDPIVVDKNANFKQVDVANLISPGGNVPADLVGRVSRIHFTQAVGQFGFLVDPSSATSIQFIVNNQALPPRHLTTGIVQFVGVEDLGGFSDITIIAGGNIGQGFVADRFSYVLLSAI
jgi:hypothetical protein